MLSTNTKGFKKAFGRREEEYLFKSRGNLLNACYNVVLSWELEKREQTQTKETMCSEEVYSLIGEMKYTHEAVHAWYSFMSTKLWWSCALELTTLRLKSHFPSCKWLTHSKPQLPHEYNRNHNSNYLRVLF